MGLYAKSDMFVSYKEYSQKNPNHDLAQYLAAYFENHEFAKQNLCAMRDKGDSSRILGKLPGDFFLIDFKNEYRTVASLVDEDLQSQNTQLQEIDIRTADVTAAEQAQQKRKQLTYPKLKAHLDKLIENLYNRISTDQRQLNKDIAIILQNYSIEEEYFKKYFSIFIVTVYTEALQKGLDQAVQDMQLNDSTQDLTHDQESYIQLFQDLVTDPLSSLSHAYRDNQSSTTENIQPANGNQPKKAEAPASPSLDHAAQQASSPAAAQTTISNRSKILLLSIAALASALIIVGALTVMGVLSPLGLLAIATGFIVLNIYATAATGVIGGSLLLYGAYKLCNWLLAATDAKPNPASEPQNPVAQDLSNASIVISSAPTKTTAAPTCADSAPVTKTVSPTPTLTDSALTTETVSLKPKGRSCCVFWAKATAAAPANNSTEENSSQGKPVPGGQH